MEHNCINAKMCLLQFTEYSIFFPLTSEILIEKNSRGWRKMHFIRCDILFGVAPCCMLN